MKRWLDDRIRLERDKRRQQEGIVLDTSVVLSIAVPDLFRQAAAFAGDYPGIQLTENATHDPMIQMIEKVASR